MKSVPRSGPGTESYFEKQLFRNALPAVDQLEMLRRNQKSVTFEVLSMENPNFWSEKP